jgi:hypothetical protein|tara:strand:+ start:53 stop:679 length:627 start_codon:yes stop_codon:yes gene_type:complete
MPNWCDNQVTITGPNSVIDKIEKIVKEEKDDQGLLNFMRPMPKELDGTTSPSSSADKPQPMVEGFDCWYDWRCENWGTKWEVCEFYGVDRQGDTISFGFSSAWAPPIPAYQTFLMNMSEQKQDVSLKAYYYEGGCDFMGCWDNGDDECLAPGDYKSTDDFWNDGIGYELDEMFNITESMAEYEAELEAEKEDVTEYVKGKAINIGEEA